MKPTPTLRLLFWLLCWLPATAWADCTTPRIIRSMQNGNFNTASTWVGGAVPTICDYVVIDHAVTLDVAFTTGQNSHGSIVVNNGASLTGANNITINSGYSLTNNGTLSINNVQMNSGGATFVNNGTATLNATQSWDTGSQVINSGYLTVNGGINLISGRLDNRAAGGRLIMNGQLDLKGNSVWNNVGYFKNNSNDTAKGIFLEGTNSTVYNRATGRIVMTGGGIWLTTETYFYNENYISVLNWESHDDRTTAVTDGSVQNIDTLLVGGTLINGSPFKNYAGANISITGNLNQISKAQSFLGTDGYVGVGGNFSNDKRIGGSTGGQFKITGTSTNTANGLVEGAVDFCDPSVTGNNTNGYPLIFDSNSNSNAGTNFGVSTAVTRCGYVAPTASLKPSTINGPATVCPSSTGNVFSIATVSGATSYVWAVPSGWTVTAGAGTTSITVTAGTASGAISVRVNGSGSTYAITSKFVMASGTAPATPGTITGPNTTTCPSTQGYAYTIQPVSGATSYTWTVPTSWVINYGQGTTSISVTAGATAGNVSVTASNACGTSTARTLAVGPPATLTAPTFNTYTSPDCTGQNRSYSVTAVTGADGYRWAVSGISGAVIDANGAISPGIYGNSRNINFPNPGTATITVTPVNACGDGPPVSANVTIVSSGLSTPTFVASSGNTNKSNPCVNNAGYIYQINAVTNATSYSWTVPSGWVITSPTGATNSGTQLTTPATSITVTPSATAGSVQVVVNNPCSGSTNASFSVTPQASPTAPTLSAPATFCPGSAYSATATFATGNTPTWTLPSGWGTPTINTTATSSTLSITPSTATAADGNVSVYVTNSTSSCQSAVTTQAVASTSPQPTFTATSATTNPGAVTAGQSYTYQVNPITGASTYTWTVPSGWTITAGAGTTAITVTATATGGNVSVTATKSGCVSIPATRAVTANSGTVYTATGYSASKKMSCYTTGQGLYQASDADGSITNAVVQSGSLPAGVELVASTGEIRVSNASAIVAGTSNFTIRTTDAMGGQTTSSTITMTFTADQVPTVTVSAKKNLESYNNNDVLATYNDPDGAITLLSLDSGVLPAGTVLNSSTGQVLVQDKTKLTPGDYTFTVNTSNTGCTVGQGQRLTALSIGNSVALPVELKAFAARRTNKEVLLTWTTASEKNSDYFAVERSVDGREFVQLTVVGAQGNSSRPVAYTTTDVNTLPTRAYYRLRLVDRDGTRSYSPVQVVAAYQQSAAGLVASLYPNPTTGSARLQLSSGSAPVQVAIFQAVGTRVFAQTLQPGSGGEVELSLAAYPAGIYLVKVQVNGQQTTLRVTKQ